MINEAHYKSEPDRAGGVMPFEGRAIPGETRTPYLASGYLVQRQGAFFGLKLATPSASHISSSCGKIVHPLRHTCG